MKETRVINSRVFKLKYFGATNTKSSRVKIIDCRFNKSKTIYNTHNHMSMKDDALDYLKSRGIKIIRSGELNNDGDVLISDDFETDLIKDEVV